MADEVKMLSRVDLLNKSVECSVVLSDRCISSRCKQAHYTVISHYTPGFFLFFFLCVLVLLITLLNFKTTNHLVCLFISLTLHAVIDVFSCVKVSILCDASVSSSHLFFPLPALPNDQTRFYRHSHPMDQWRGVSSGETVAAVLEYCAVCGVNIVL